MTRPVQISHSLHQWMDVFMHRSMRGWSHFAKNTGLSMPQVSILMQLHHRGPCGISEISERFDITAAAASQPHPERKSVLVEANALLFGDILGYSTQIELAFRMPFALDARNTSKIGRAHV